MHPSPNISRGTVIGCEAKYELAKKWSLGAVHKVRHAIFGQF